MKPKTIHTTESILARTEEEGNCMLWKGYIANKTPQVEHNGKMTNVRRVLLELAGTPSTADFLAPKCKNSRCVNPEHIEPQTRKQHMVNMAHAANKGAVGMIRKARSAKARRAREGALGKENAMLIAASEESGPVLAERYGVTRSTINSIKRGKTWSAGLNPFAGLM